MSWILRGCLSLGFHGLKWPHNVRSGRPALCRRNGVPSARGRRPGAFLAGVGMAWGCLPRFGGEPLCRACASGHQTVEFINDKGRPKIGDLGLAEPLAARLRALTGRDRRWARCGIRSRSNSCGWGKVDARADISSLGVTGRVLWRQPSPADRPLLGGGDVFKSCSQARCRLVPATGLGD